MFQVKEEFSFSCFGNFVIIAKGQLFSLQIALPSISVYQFWNRNRFLRSFARTCLPVPMSIQPRCWKMATVSVCRLFHRRPSLPPLLLLLLPQLWYWHLLLPPQLLETHTNQHNVKLFKTGTFRDYGILRAGTIHIYMARQAKYKSSVPPLISAVHNILPLKQSEGKRLRSLLFLFC